MAKKKPITNPASLYRIERRLTPKALAAFAKAVEKWKRDVAAGKVPSYTALKPLVKVTEDGLQMAGLAVAANTSQALGIKLDFTVTNPKAIRWSKENAARLIKDITDETRAAVRAATTRAVGGKLTVDKLARYVREIVGLTEKQEGAVWNFYERAIDSGFSDADARDEANAYAEKLRRYRSEVIARSEILRAENRGQELVWEQGVENGQLRGLVREWMATPDELTCPICSEMDGQQTEIGEPWTGPDGDPIMTPQESHPMCRCSQGLVEAR